VRALLVEADPLQARILADYLQEGGFTVETHAEPPSPPDRFDLLVVDRSLSAELVASNRRRPPRDRLPLILLVDDAAQEDVIQGLESGHYIASKPVGRAFLLALAERAIRSRSRLRDLSEELERDREGLHQLVEARFEFRTREEACAVAGSLSQAFPPSKLLSVGILEVLINAVEHGNLEIGGARKQALIETGRLDEEVARRLRDPRLGARRAYALLRRTTAEIWLVVEDQGPGFDERALTRDGGAFHGRGIEMARAAGFSTFRYEPPGNRVVAMMRLHAASCPRAQARALVD